jgi:hypothetical protein
LALLLVWVVEKVQPRLLLSDKVYEVPERLTVAVRVSPGCTG